MIIVMDEAGSLVMPWREMERTMNEQMLRSLASIIILFGGERGSEKLEEARPVVHNTPTE